MSYEFRTVADQRPAMVALEQIRRSLGQLPAADFDISPIFPGRLAISLHHDISDFEAWRGALGIPAETVKYDTQSDNSVLTATASWGGASVELVGYGPLPKADDEDGAK